MGLKLINDNNSNNSNQVIYNENVKILKFTHNVREFTVCLWKLTAPLRRLLPKIGK